MTSSPATSRPRIPRRGAGASTPAVQVDEPPRRRTVVRANAPHVVPFDTLHEPGPAEPDEDSPERTARRPRRSALVVAVPVAVVVIGLAAVALGLSGRSGAPQGAAEAGGVASAPQGGGAASAATGLDPELERRFALAVEDAAADGVTLTLTSGWRSAEDQAGLVESAVERYGSAEEARRWVLPPERSAHVAGRAVDVGPTDGALWLEQHGADHGLCRVYANELWHFEPVVEPGGVCPALLDDSSSGWDGLG